MKWVSLVFFLPLLVCGCTHTISYKLTEGDRWTGPKIGGVLRVQPFADLSVALTNKEETGSDGTWRVTYRKGYESTNLSAAVTAMVVKHLAYSGLFTKVVAGTETNADWTLSGNLTEFEARGCVNHTAENIQMASAGFGLIGAVVGSTSTIGMKSEIKTAVKLDQLNLHDKTGQSRWSDSIAITNDVRSSFNDANETVVFIYPDNGLKDAVTEMIRRLGNSALTNQAVPVTR